MKNYAVCAKGGHVGRNYYHPVTYAVQAENGREAAAAVRNYPRVKHDRKDAILSVQEIDDVSYKALKEENRQDPYLHCTSIQEQRKSCTILERIREPETAPRWKQHASRSLRYLCRKYKEQAYTRRIDAEDLLPESA